jgi:hypothetical protein
MTTPDSDGGQSWWDAEVTTAGSELRRDFPDADLAAASQEVGGRSWWAAEVATPGSETRRDFPDVDWSQYDSDSSPSDNWSTSSPSNGGIWSTPAVLARALYDEKSMLQQEIRANGWHR